MQVTIDYFGMQGTGRNVTTAKKDAGAKITAALSGDYNPAIIECRGTAALIFRTPTGWMWRTIVDEDGISHGVVYGNGGYGEKQEVVDTVRYHLAQQAWQPEDGETPALSLDKSQRYEFSRWVEFQLRYREAKERGMDSTDCHDYAGRNPARPELWDAA